MIWSWIPGVLCGPFRFGEPLPPLDIGRLTRLEPSCEGAAWQTYRVGDEEARVRVEDGVVTAVECIQSLKFLGRSELLGLPVRAAQERLGATLVETKRWEDGSAMYEAERLGLTLWVEGERVESATVEACME